VSLRVKSGGPLSLVAADVQTSTLVFCTRWSTFSGYVRSCISFRLHLDQGDNGFVWMAVFGGFCRFDAEFHSRFLHKVVYLLCLCQKSHFFPFQLDQGDREFVWMEFFGGLVPLDSDFYSQAGVVALFSMDTVIPNS